MAASREEVIAALRKAYMMEVETVINYLANSLHLEGVRAEAIKSSLAADINEELTHARSLGNRIKQLGGTIPGSKELKFSQDPLQPPKDPTDVVGVIRGVLAAEDDAIKHYQSIIRMTEGDDYVTQELAISNLADEDAHRQQFEGYLKEYTKG
ncbi:MAG: ferritin-like domain-containing protein [Gemmatales bacterium]|nr:ferritin-like domain-containing protein [Gemmatales bacterium]MDW8385775.1 ferritin-like domain-containing protein [Gemmatales bacterium]